MICQNRIARLLSVGLPSESALRGQSGLSFMVKGVLFYVGKHIFAGLDGFTRGSKPRQTGFTLEITPWLSLKMRCLVMGQDAIFCAYI